MAAGIALSGTIYAAPALADTVDPEAPVATTETPAEPTPQAPLASPTAEVALPVADVLDVDFTSGSVVDRAHRTPYTETGEVVIDVDPVLGVPVANVDGDDALLYPIADRYEAMTDSFTVECTFKYNADLPPQGHETDPCGNKESGGFSITVYNNMLMLTLNTGSYKYATMPMVRDQWYHAVAVYNGAEGTAQLYVNGKLVSTNATMGSSVTWPPYPDAQNWVIGGDSGMGNTAQFFVNASIANSRLYSDPLTADQISALYENVLGEASAQELILESTVPAEGSTINSDVTFDVEWNTPEMLASNAAYLLDGEPIELGQKIGSGLTSGEHTITIEGTTVFGDPVAHTVTFTSGSVPVAGGTDAAEGEGTVSLSATVTNPDGRDVVSTFYAGRANLAESGFQGFINTIPSSLNFEYTDGAEIGASADSLSAAEGQYAFQRFNLEVGEYTDGQAVRWSGDVDPARQVELRVWNNATGAWDRVATGRGLTEGELVVSGAVSADHVADGTINAMIVGVDPFADDLENTISDSLASPDEYDFAIAHFTDTQYLTEGAEEDAYSDEQRAVWAESYRAIPEWIVENADERKIEYVAHTGDIIENNHYFWYNNEAYWTQVADEEFIFASTMQEILDAAEIPNGVLPGNHDNRTGSQTGPDSPYNQYFGPERYEALEQTAGWQAANASYTPWQANDNDNHYDLFSAGGLDFIAVYLGYDVTQAEIDWANSVLAEYSDRNAMIMTHAYRIPSDSPDGRGSEFSHDGARINNGILQQNDNVFLILSGHEHGVSIGVRNDVGSEGNHVVELLADYQFYEVTADEVGLTGVDGRSAGDLLMLGSSFFRMLQFDVDRSELIVDTYSPFLDNYGATEYDDESRYTGTEDDTRLPIQLETRRTSFTTDSVMATTPTDEVIGEQTVASGTAATVTWTGLAEGETYAWYVTSRDAANGTDIPAGETVQMGVFTATEEGTDQLAPELTLPGDVSIVEGETFDAMAGVTAVDNLDGDITDRVQVIGSVDTAVPGTYTLTYTVSDTGGNQATASRTITVTEAPVDTGNGGGDDNDNGAGDGDNGDGTGDDGTGDDNNTGTGDDAAAGSSNGTGTKPSTGTPSTGSGSTGNLAHTGVEGTPALLIGGLLSIMLGGTAWVLSRRKSNIG